MEVLLALLLALLVKPSEQISCKNEDGKDVDWYIFYKLPKISSEKSGTSFADGSAYVFLTSEGDNDKWTLSDVDIGSPMSILGQTWKSYANADSSDVSYLFYNDDPPGNITTSSVGHTKGIVAFDSQSGFWLRYSIPNFGEATHFAFPSSALTNGQIGICITLDSLRDVCDHLLFCGPNIYNSRLSKTMSTSLDKDQRSLFTKRPAFVRKAPFEKKSWLTSLDRQHFLVFSKDNQLGVDIYSDILAPELKTSLLAETWRRGAGTSLNSDCDDTYSVVNIRALLVRPWNRKKELEFQSTEDHSKWALTVDRRLRWVCIGDLNRMASQSKRGGGATCFQSLPVWKAFQSVIYETDECPS